MPNSCFLFINAYFPTDSHNNNFDDSELLRTLQDIQFLLDTYGEGCEVVLMGDLNADLSRNTLFVQIVKNFLLENNLITAWSNVGCDFTYYQERVVRGRTVISHSVIDHFCVKSDSIGKYSDIMPLHIAANLSNHAPIYLKIQCDVTFREPINTKSNSHTVHKPQWERASQIDKDNYIRDLSSLLRNTVVHNEALHRRDADCASVDHKLKLDDMCTNVLDCISIAVEDRQYSD